MFAIALVSALVLSASPEEKKEAGVHYQRAVTFYKEGDFRAALGEFRAAYEVAPSFEVLFNQALCERRLFNYARAVRLLDQYLLEGGARIPPDRRDAVSREVAAIRVLTAPVAVIVEGPPSMVLVDGERIGETPLQDLLVLSVGQHKVRAECDGCSPDERTIDVRSGRAQSIQLSPASLTAPVDVQVECATAGVQLSADGQAPVACPAKLALVPGSHELVGSAPGFASQRTEVVVQPGKARKVNLSLVELPPRFPTLGVSVLGGGVALGGLGVAFALMAGTNAQRTSTVIRAGGPWDATAVANQQAGQRNSTLGWTFLGVGAAALAAGVVTVVWQVSTPAQAPVAVSFSPTPGGLAACASF